MATHDATCMHQRLTRLVGSKDRAANRMIGRSKGADSASDRGWIHGSGKRPVMKKQGTTREMKRTRLRQSGIVMLEALIALMIISTTVVTGLLGVSTASRVTANTSAKTTAALATASQIELIRDSAYVTTGGQYSLITPPEGMTVSNETTSITGGNANIQAVTVRVSQGGETILETTIIKADK